MTDTKAAAELEAIRVRLGVKGTNESTEMAVAHFLQTYAAAKECVGQLERERCLAAAELLKSGISVGDSHDELRGGIERLALRLAATRRQRDEL